MHLVFLWVAHDRNNQKSLIDLRAKHQTFYYYRQTSIFLTLPEHIAGYWNLPRPTLILKIYSKNIVLNMHFSIFFDTFGRMPTGLWFPLNLFYLFCASACLGISGNVFSLTFTGISELFDALFTSSFKISF